MPYSHKYITYIGFYVDIVHKLVSLCIRQLPFKRRCTIDALQRSILHIVSEGKMASSPHVC